MDVHGEDEPANIFADNEILDCDMPASHKCNGTAGHSHDFHPCAFCDVDIVKVNTPEGYDNCKYHTLAACLLIFCLDMQPGHPRTITKCFDKVFIRRTLPRHVKMRS